MTNYRNEDQFSTVVSSEGVGAPLGYQRPLVGNGEVSLLVGPLGGVGAGPDGVVGPPIFRAGRRYGSPRRFELIPYGFYDIVDEVGGSPVDTVLSWEQSLDLTQGCVRCRSRYAGGVEICTTVLAPLGWDALLIRQRVSVDTPSSVSVDQRFVYAFSADANTGVLPPGVRLLPTPMGRTGSRLLYEAAGQTEFVGCVLLGAMGIATYASSANRLEAVVRNQASLGRPSEACWLLTFSDTSFRPVVRDLDAVVDPAEKLTEHFLDVGFDGIAGESAEAWSHYWSESSVAVPDAAIGQMYRTALYHLRCNATKWSQPVGLLNSHWSGRYFGWDEMFCHQALLWSGHAELARRIPEFRYAVLEPARRRVAHYDNQDIYGARYPWETLEDGSEGTPPGFWCDHVFHISNIAVSAWSQYVCTLDREYLSHSGFPVLRDCARFFLTHCVYEDNRGGKFIGKTTDLERLGPARERAFMTTCGVIYTLRAAAQAVDVLSLGEHAPEADVWRHTAASLVESLPEKKGRYIACPGVEQESIATTGGLFPYSLFDSESSQQTLAVTHFVEHGRAAGNMYPVGNRICAWYAGWMTVVLSAVGDASGALRFLKEAAAVTGLFGECFEINEGGIQCRPWFSTASGNVIHGLNRMLVDFDEKTIKIAPGVPTEWKDFSFTLPCGWGRIVEVAVCAGVLVRLRVSAADGSVPSLAHVRIPTRLCPHGRLPEGWLCYGKLAGALVLRPDETSGG